jgi:hypothetical protein
MMGLYNESSLEYLMLIAFSRTLPWAFSWMGKQME